MENKFSKFLSSPTEIVGAIGGECIACVSVVDVGVVTTDGDVADFVGHEVEVWERRRDNVWRTSDITVTIVDGSLSDGVLKLNPDFLVSTSLTTKSF
jgi:hypothetical protein